MKNDLEQLLNSLIEKGWKPFGYNTIDNILIEGDNYKFISRGCYSFITNIRLLVSKESGLWQFCIANHLLKKYSDLGDDYEYIIGRWQNGMDGKTTDGEYIDENYDTDIYHQDESYQYRLIESALCDKDKLEDFLLSNVNLEG